MKTEEIIYKLELIFEKTFSKKIELKIETTPLEVSGWDSLMHIAILANIQEEFNIRFSVKEMRSLFNIKDIVNIIQNKTC